MIVKKNLSEQIYEDIKQDILDQNIGFGEKLTNRGLQEKYGVSSTPVRDAINRLYLDGLIDNISNVGARVIPFDYKMAIEVNEVISILSREAIALSAQRTPQETVVPLLDHILNLQVKNIGNESYYQYDRQFHKVFFDFCGNSRIERVYAQNSVLWMLLIRFYYRDKGSVRSKAVAEHERVFVAYMQRDIALAQRCMELHFHEAVRPMNRMLDNPVP